MWCGWCYCKGTPGRAVAGTGHCGEDSERVSVGRTEVLQEIKRVFGSGSARQSCTSEEGCTPKANPASKHICAARHLLLSLA